MSTRAIASVVAALSLIASSEATEPLRIIVIGAHPDDCELDAGGTAARWVKAGFKVKFVSLTNGDIGHHEMAGGILARRRAAEVAKSAQILGVDHQVLDIHDGELLPTLENRRSVCKVIREWKADVVVGPRTNDYHPDHRYTGVLIQDTAYMVGVPNFCPDIPPLRKNPVYLYTEDSFKKPNPFVPDIVVSIDPTFEQKVDAIDAIESQFYEWLPWIDGYLDQVPQDKAARKQFLREKLVGRYGSSAKKYRGKLDELLGTAEAAKVKTAEAFEVCEYGTQPSKDDLLKIFPFFESK